MNDNLLPILAALAVALVIAFLLLRPRQSVRLTDSAPVRPHMTRDSSKEGNGLPSEAAAAASDVAGEIIDARVHDQLGASGGTLDDFTRMKGVGPKFAQILVARGFTRYGQLASLSPDEIDRLDDELGPFRGRIVRDRVVDQADYLARGDSDGFEQNFGKLG